MIKKLLLFLFLTITGTTYAQLLTWSPSFPTESTSGITITVDGSKGNQGLLSYNPIDVYVHIGVITNKSSDSGDWKYVTSVWGEPDPNYKATPLTGLSRWSFTITPSLRSYFNITDPTETIEKIAILFRSGNGSKKQTNTDGSDMYVPVYTENVAVRITQPPYQPLFTPEPETITKSTGDNISLTAVANKTSDMKLFLNGVEIASASGVTTISTNPLLEVPGTQVIVAEADDGVNTSNQTLSFFASSDVNIAPLPAGVKPGINYIDESTATLVLYAPGKNRVSVIGDLPDNNWTEKYSYQMNKTSDGNYWWITLSDLDPGYEYSFQYLIDGTLRIADPYAEKILDPYNDQYISSATYPDLKPYPTGLTTEVVSILQTDKPEYVWSGKTYTRPDQRNLIIYELLVRDFVDKHDWNTLRDTLNYLKKLGVNAIELLPFNEFEGNLSWGYNPDFYFAPDKYYGPANNLKEFIDSCHSNGIAVIMDIALNHSFGMSPLVRLYWDAANNRPLASNPWFNPVAKHAFNVGYDMNHENAQTKDLTGRVIGHWLNEYKIDGFRFDLSKGFTQKQTCDINGNNCDVNGWSAYDQSRIDIWKGYYDTVQNYSSGAYCILEHFADNSEEKVLSDYGMMLWGNSNYNYNQASMGYESDWNFDWTLSGRRGWDDLNLVSYMESHDEERLMYKNLQYGNSNGSYNIKSFKTALERQALAAAFFFTLPGPKMIWQFGELGYDYSINHCQDGTINSNCRTDPSPIRWDYYQDSDRKALFNVYRNLIHLRKNPAFFEAFTTNQIEYDFSGAFKWLRINTTAGKLVVFGNFDVVSKAGSVTFPVSGTWYDYLEGSTFSATGASQSFTLQPGEFRIFTNTFVPLSVELKSFSGTVRDNLNVLTWEVTAEKNIIGYEVQGSKDGTNFNTKGKVIATGKNIYEYIDSDITGSDTWYYRLKIEDQDGSVTYSNIVALRSNNATMKLQVMPNPFENILKFRIDMPAGQKADILITGADGRQLIQKTVQLLPGSNDVTVYETGRLPQGVYFLRINTNDKSTVTRIFKQK